MNESEYINGHQSKKFKSKEPVLSYEIKILCIYIERGMVEQERSCKWARNKLKSKEPALL